MSFVCDSRFVANVLWSETVMCDALLSLKVFYTVCVCVVDTRADELIDFIRYTAHTIYTYNFDSKKYFWSSKMVEERLDCRIYLMFGVQFA